MIRLIKNEPIRHNGVYYDFTMLDQKKLQKVYDTNPSLRHFFETDEETTPSITTTNFEEELAKVGILTSNITNKRLAELKKRREDDKID